MVSLLNYRYQVGEKIGQGSFGKVYEATDIRTAEKRYAIKAESLKCRSKTLETEAVILKEMRKESGYPKFYKLFTQRGNRYLVMQKLGRSLQD
jgi:serine/threonine protein kinase